MAFGAALCVVDGTEPFGDVLAFLEDPSQVVEFGLGHDPGGHVVEAGWRFRRAGLALHGEREHSEKPGGRHDKEIPCGVVSTLHGGLPPGWGMTNGGCYRR